jgi:fucose permease
MITCLSSVSTLTYHKFSLECHAEIGQASAAKNTTDDSTFSQIIRSKSVHLLALFLLVYVGVEVTIGGLFMYFLCSCKY